MTAPVQTRRFPGEGMMSKVSAPIVSVGSAAVSTVGTVGSAVGSTVGTVGSAVGTVGSTVGSFVGAFAVDPNFLENQKVKGRFKEYVKVFWLAKFTHRSSSRCLENSFRPPEAFRRRGC